VSYKTLCNILRIEKSSIFDGAGLRSVVFFKGCPMQCAWCSTPESQRFEPEIGFYAAKCMQCGACAGACPYGALTFAGEASLPREIYTGCFACAAACRKQVIKKYGKNTSIAEIVDEVCKDEVFYFHSGGGVTLSGGEPCAQSNCAAELLRELKKRGLDTSIETALCVPWESIEALLPYLDCILADIKHMDCNQHRFWTGVDNSLILDNIRRLDSSDFPFPLIIRIPLVPGINDGDNNLNAVAVLASGLTKKLQSIELLPYHRLGSNTYRLLGKQYRLEATAVCTVKHAEERANFLRSCNPGVPVFAGQR
jgi:pyruvate formate lyase activating enzyme